MLDLLWEKSQQSGFIVGIKDKFVKSVGVPDADEARRQATVLDEQGFDTYFSPASFDGQRTQAGCTTVGSLWFDLDCGDGKPYADKAEGLRAVVAWLKQTSFPPPSLIVDSGYGLHFYWLLDGQYPHDEWLPVARHFKQAHKLAGLHADPTRTADAASIMRMPGTFNRKHGGKREVKVLRSTGQRHALDALQTALPPVGPQGVVQPSETDPEWSTRPELPEGDAEAITKGCAQMRNVRDKQGAVDEPLWRAALSVVSRCVGGAELVHEWSQGDERYDAQQTQAKAASTTGPYLCRTFDDLNPGGCKGCAFAGKVTSPINIAPAAPVALEKDAPAWKMNKVGRFTCTANGIYFAPPAAEDAAPEPPVGVTQFPMWVSEVRERARFGEERDAAHLVLQWVSIDGRHKSGLLKLSELGEPRALMAWLHDHTLGVGTQEAKLLMVYISQYTASILRKQGARQYHTVLGWAPEGFVLGSRIISKDGAKETLVQSSNPVSKIKANGTVAGWTSAASVLGEEGYWRHAFAVLAGFGSPLLELAEKQSAVVSLVGPSGAGKTLAAQLALSIYGDPKYLSQGSTSTDAAIELQLTGNQHVPYLLDEVTQYHPKRLAGLLYLAANGQGKASSTRGRETRVAGTWRLVTYITSNQPILEFAQDQIQEAHRRRLLELYFSTPISKDDAAQAVQAVLQHAGAPADLYLQRVAAMRDGLPKMFEKAEARLAARLRLPAVNRFALWTLTAAYVGGMIAKSLGLIDWDVEKIVLAAGGEVFEAATETKTNEERAVDGLCEWLTENSRHICYWDAHNGDLGTPTDDAIARVLGEGKLALHYKRLTGALHEQGVPMAALNRALDGILVRRSMVRLAPGTPPVYTLVVKMEPLGLESDTLGEG